MADGYFFVRSRGKISGPFDLAGLQRLVRLGMLSRVHEVSTDKQNWIPASRTPGLFPDTGAVAAGVGAGYQPAAPEEEPQGSYEVADIPPPPLPAPVAASAATMQCLSCGGIFPAAQVYLDRGRNICASCFQKQAATEENAVAPGGGARESYRGMAVASMVLGICGLVIPFVGLICGILAIIFGSTASRGNKRLASRDGSGMATAGLIMGIISLAFYLAGLAFWLIVVLGVAAGAAHGAG